MNYSEYWAIIYAYREQEGKPRKFDSIFCSKNNKHHILKKKIIFIRREIISKLKNWNHATSIYTGNVYSLLSFCYDLRNTKWLYKGEFRYWNSNLWAQHGIDLLDRQLVYASELACILKIKRLTLVTELKSIWTCVSILPSASWWKQPAISCWCNSLNRAFNLDDDDSNKFPRKACWMNFSNTESYQKLKQRKWNSIWKQIRRTQRGLFRY